MQYFMQMQLAAAITTIIGSVFNYYDPGFIIGIIILYICRLSITSSAINVIAKAISREDVHFNDLFVAFKKVNMVRV